jgi:hypothetical protein
MAKNANGKLVVRGLFVGDVDEVYERAAALSVQVNFRLMDREMATVCSDGMRLTLKAVVYLDAGEFKSTWLGNKAIYRTRMAMADGGCRWLQVSLTLQGRSLFWHRASKNSARIWQSTR